ncbi:LysE family translocator [Pontivivens ytuae]|uniref:LysE family translocator n=1 Tax=Pontivivens ytuae TaxID=2789856 RepID=A0A7S9LTQ6_9RHOB|nr:LysE family translocator [Pontivivens ytuae]QPH55062.1 LysE family translocator [Pontivivens ytuae]
MPVDPATLLAFLAACIVIYVIPGPDMAYIAANSLSGGRRGGLLAATGTVVGASIHALAAALGVSAIFAASPVAFEVVRWAGVGYLAWLGWQALRSDGRTEAAGAPPKRPLLIIAKGTAINVLNPKVALFFLAFLPQFADPAAGALTAQLATLGLTFALGGAVWCAGLALVFAWAGGRLGASARVARWRSRITGSLFLTFAGALALGDR